MNECMHKSWHCINKNMDKKYKQIYATYQNNICFIRQCLFIPFFRVKILQTEFPILYMEETIEKKTIRYSYILFHTFINLLYLPTFHWKKEAQIYTVILYNIINLKVYLFVFHSFQRF